MARYASKKSYGGQRASVGRVVVVARAVTTSGRVELRAGVIATILPSGEPSIDVIGLADAWQEAPFVETKTTSDVEAMPAGSWTWPPRVP